MSNLLTKHAFLWALCLSSKNVLAPLALMLLFVSQSSGQSLSEADGFESGCDTIKMNGNLRTLLGDLDDFDTRLDRFFEYAECETSNSQTNPAPPFQLFLLDPASRIKTAVDLINHLDKHHNGPLITPRILNRRDKQGRTMLDFLEYQKENTYRDNNSVRSTLDRLRAKMCKFGAVHTIPRSDCVAKNKYAKP